MYHKIVTIITIHLFDKLISPLFSYNPANSLWNGFGMYDTAAGYPHQPVYPGMVNPGAYMPPLQNVMRIGECSVKPVGQ